MTLTLFVCLFTLNFTLLTGSYTDEFVVEVLGGISEARAVAEELGFTYVRPVSMASHHLLSLKIIVLKDT